MSIISSIGLSSEPVVIMEQDLMIPSTNTSGDLPATTTSDSDILQAAVHEERLIPSTSTSGDIVLRFAQLLPVAVLTEKDHLLKYHTLIHLPVSLQVRHLEAHI